MAKTKFGTICVANLCRSAVDEMIYLDGEFETFRFAHKGTPIPICGCRKPKQVRELAEAVNVKLTPGEMRRLEEAADQSGARVLGHDLFRFAVLKKRS